MKEITMPSSAQAPRVLLIRRRYLGDVVLLGSVLRNLRLQWPSAYIAVLTERAYLGVLALNPDVSAAWEMPASRQVLALTALAWRIRRAQFTHVIDVDNTDKTALLTRASGAAQRITFGTETGKLHLPWVYNRFAKTGDVFYATNHITETYLQLLVPAGVPIRTREVRLVPQPADVAAMAAVVGALRTPRTRRVLVHPGSRSPFRIWPVERFAEVCDRLQREHDTEVFIVAGPHEQELARQIRERMRTSAKTIDRVLTIGELAALIAQFEVFFCHDSGPMHVAAAVNTPVVALLSSQNAAIWRPFGENHTILQTPLPCACIGDAAPTPCDRTNGYRSYCVRMISVETAYAAVVAALGKKNASSDRRDRR